jgi:CheY-like chemotaxis protein
MTTKKRAQILHLENLPEWIREVQLALGEEHDIQAATSLREAVRLFRDTDFDLVIVDIDLISGIGVDEEGFRLLKGLQDAGILPGNRVIVLSAFAHLEERTRRAFRDYDVWDVIPKDKYNPEELKREVAEAIQTPLHYGD